jgi:hypothetical protein
MFQTTNQLWTINNEVYHRSQDPSKTIGSMATNGNIGTPTRTNRIWVKLTAFAWPTGCPRIVRDQLYFIWNLNLLKSTSDGKKKTGFGLLPFLGGWIFYQNLIHTPRLAILQAKMAEAPWKAVCIYIYTHTVYWWYSCILWYAMKNRYALPL